MYIVVNNYSIYSDYISRYNTKINVKSMWIKSICIKVNVLLFIPDSFKTR